MNIKLIIYLLITLCLTSSSTVYSQIRSYGIKLGVVSTNQKWDYSAIADRENLNRLGVDVGIYIEWLDMPVLSLISELHFTERGMGEEFKETTPAFPEGTGRTFRFDYAIDYISLPILAKARLELEKVDVFIFVGPRIDITLGWRDGADIVFDNFRDISYGPTLGGGIVFQNLLLDHNLGVEYRFSPSIGHEYSTPLLEVRSKSMEFLIDISL